uniref:Uncharacterized protein n=1 Tax=Setaria digitata TaxID=48799 RepID=A0A915PQG0_9BILA
MIRDRDEVEVEVEVALKEDTVKERSEDDDRCRRIFCDVYAFHDGDREPVFPESIKAPRVRQCDGEKWRSRESAHTRRLPMRLLPFP